MRFNRLLLVLAVFGMSFSLSAQSIISEDSLNMIISLEKEYTAAMKANNFMKAQQKGKEALDLFNRLSPAFREHNPDLEGEIYYTLAYSNTLSGKYTEVAEYLRKAAELNRRFITQYRHDMRQYLGHPEINKILAQIKDIDLNHILREGEYAPLSSTTGLPKFTYASASDPRLVQLREELNLDKVAGDGDEISKIKNLTTFIHNRVHHNGSSGIGCARNGKALWDFAADGRGELNCRGMALLLNECFLAMGFPSRYITCFPRDFGISDQDCHVINAVYSGQLGKWVWMDPSFNAWFTDDDGTLLGIDEVRRMVMDGRTPHLNPEANHYNGQLSPVYYLDYYMTKNLYALEACDTNVYGTEDSSLGVQRTFIVLQPVEFSNDNYNAKVKVSDPEWFWQKPE